MTDVDIGDVAENIISKNTINDASYAKSIAKVCLSYQDEYTQSLGIELLGLVLDEESKTILLNIDINNTCELEDLCLIEALQRLNSEISKCKVFEIAENIEKSRTVCVSAYSSLYSNWADITLNEKLRLKSLFTKELDEVVKVVLSGLLFLITRENFYWEYISNKSKSNDVEVSEEALRCQKDVLSYFRD